MGVSSVVVLYFVAFGSVVNTMISQHIMSIMSGIYCQEYIILHFASANPSQCAVMYAADKMCVAFSHREEQCFLHSGFCDVGSLPIVEGSSYSGKCLLM